MSQWVIQGLRTGIKTTAYPREQESAAGVSPGRPIATELPEQDAESLSARCPTGALKNSREHLSVDFRRCIHCFRCARENSVSVRWEPGYEWAFMAGNNARGSGCLPRTFERSVHILVVDAGDCGACLNEVKQLNNPYYNFHRLGFFFTPSPRHADVLLVVGALAEQMRKPLQMAYDAMPAPKRVVAVGSCALTGGIFGPSFACAGAVSKLLPVDVEVPGNPPPPLAILHGLLLLTGRKASSFLDHDPAEQARFKLSKAS